MSLLKKYSFLMIYLLVPLPVAGLYLGGWYLLLPFLIFFALIPLIDFFFLDKVNLSQEQEQVLIKNNFFKYITWLYIPMHIMLLVYSAYAVTTQNLHWYVWLGFTVSLGLFTGGVGLNIAHEMMHKNCAFQQFLSKILLITVCYGHFFIEHVKGHHVRVGTPEDPATARLGQSLYHFIPKTMAGSFQSAFHLEKNRLKRSGYSFWSAHNHFWWIIAFPMAIAIICYLYGGLITLAFFLLQSFTAIVTLEIINYIEHYGLERKRLANGHYEKVTPYHSWNASHWLSNALLFHLQRHSDHHTFGARPYQILRHMEQSPQLPSGYMGMFVLALVPPLWRRVMDKRVLAYRDRLSAE